MGLIIIIIYEYYFMIFEWWLMTIPWKVKWLWLWDIPIYQTPILDICANIYDKNATPKSLMPIEMVWLSRKAELSLPYSFSYAFR